METVDMRTLTIGDTTYAPVDELARLDLEALTEEVGNIKNDADGYLARAESAADTATSKASEAAESAEIAMRNMGEAMAGANAAADSASTATTKASSASASAKNAANSENNAKASETNAASSASAASSSANTAKGHADTATSKATAADASAKNAANSASAAAESAVSAADNAEVAFSAKEVAEARANSASGYADAAAASASTASTKASAASSSATAAAASATAAQKAADSISDGVPDYVKTEAERVAKAVQSHQGANTVSFIVCSDVHFSTVNNAAQMKETLTHMGQGMKLIRESVAVDFAACLGDAIWDASNESVEDVQEAMREVNTALFDAFNGIPNFRLVGNHEAHYNGTTKLTNAQIFANRGAFNAGATFDAANRAGGYCFRDFEANKLRVVCLNTSEGDTAGGYTMSAAQKTWLANALNVPDGWKSLILSHIPLDWYGASSAPLSIVAAADGVVCNIHGHIHNYLTGTVTNTNVPRLAIPNGCFYRANEYGKNGGTEYNGMEFGEATTYNKTAGTAQDTAFCVVTIDLDNEIVYADHYGAGYSRELSFSGSVSMKYSVTYNLANVTASSGVSEVSAGGSFTNSLTVANGYENLVVKVTMGGADVTSSAYSDGIISIGSVTGSIVITASATAVEVGPSYTNLVPTSLASGGGSVYNGTGYKNDYRLGSGGTESATTGAVCSGFIEYNDEVIRAWGCTSSSTGISGQYIVMYDSSFAKTYALAYNNTSITGLTYSQVNGKYMVTYDPSKETNATVKAYFTDAAYIRVSFGAGSGANFIVTLDEEIEF